MHLFTFHILLSNSISTSVRLQLFLKSVLDLEFLSILNSLLVAECVIN